MLVVNRRAGERVYVGEDVVITVCATRRGHVRLGIAAPPEVRILREELSDHSLSSSEAPPSPLLATALPIAAAAS
ncbi:MAG: carbon storage regulator [Planctomycetes bacterium]|nr:carbon storage regulator [Planctomycetota bacterium]